MDFQKELEQLINKYSKENDSDTPDFMLAEYMIRSLEMFNDIINKREMWYRRKSDIEIPCENQHQDHILPITPADFLDIELPNTLPEEEF